MVDIIKYKLANGLTVIMHQDNSTPLVALNILYKVGSRNESKENTGFAHLFEHLMFGGSKNVEDYDLPIQDAGGDSNAFTNSDITNYYNVLPAENLETAFWLESDRMLHLSINQKSLDVQKKVVVEEFKETCLNKPYGELWHELSALSYKVHPYQWPTIGLVPAHIEDAKLEEVQEFYQKHYRPSNAILVVAGKFEEAKTKTLIEQWFGSIPNGEIPLAEIQPEPEQEGFRTKTYYKNVPSTAVYLAFHMPERSHKDFIVYDLLSDLLGGGRSSRLYEKLLNGTDKFNTIGAYITGSLDPGLLIIESKLSDEAEVEDALNLIWDEIALLCSQGVQEEELQKVKNALSSSVAYSEVSITHKAINLAYFEMIGDANLINLQEEELDQVSAEDIKRVANKVFRKENCSQILYYPKHKEKLSTSE